jgi:hypothetical protein
LTDRYGSPWAFAGLATIALVGLAAVYLFMPETRPTEESK